MAERSYADYDPSMVDELAVQFACEGTRMDLNRDSQVVAVMLMLGKHTTSEIARRIGTYPEHVGRIARALDTVKCPMCGQHSWHDNGVLRQHMDNFGFTWCPMSRCHYADEAAYAARTAWLSTGHYSKYRAQRQQVVA